MNPRTTGILFVLVTAMALFVYFYEIRGEADRKAAEEAKLRLFPGIEAEQIDSIDFTGSDGAEIRVERRSGAGEGGGAKGGAEKAAGEKAAGGGKGAGGKAARWVVTAPVDYPGDAFALDGMADALASLKSEAVFDHAQQPEVYGLGSDARELSFEVGGQTHSLQIGAKAPVGSNTYVAVDGKGTVYTVSSFAVNALDKTLDSVRDKRIAPFDPAAIDRIEASWPGGGVTLERKDGVWRIVAPIEGPADPETVEGLLSDLSFLRADGFVDHPAPDAEIGLDPPAFSVVLTGAGSGEAPPVHVAVAIGQESEDNVRMVRAALPTRYKIAAERLEDYPRDVTAYRYKQLASFDPVDAERVELVFSPRVSTEYGDGPITITAKRGETGWSSEPEPFAEGKVPALLKRLAGLRAKGILADALGPQELAGLGLEPPLVRIRVFGADGEAPLADVRIGSATSSGAIAAQSEGNPIVFELDPAVAEQIPVSFDAFESRYRATAAPAPDEAADQAAPEGDAGDSGSAPDAAAESP